MKPSLHTAELLHEPSNGFLNQEQSS